MKPSIIRASSLLASLALLSGCAVGPDYQTPQPAADTGSFYIPYPNFDDTPMSSTWWKYFDDPLLDDLLQQARTQNWTLEAARSRVLEARAIANAQSGRFYPSLDANAQVYRQRRSLNGPIPVLPESGIGRSNTVYDASIDAAWEIDLFGRNRYQAEASDAQAQAAAFEYSDAELSLLAETANQYFTLRSLEKQLQTLDRNLAIRKRTLDLVKARHEAGTVPQLSVARAEQALLDLEAERPNLQSQRASTLLALATLCSAEPSELSKRIDEAPASTPDYTGYLGAGLPSELLRRRPDVQQAERQLAAATATLGLRVADLYPRFSLIAALGQETIDIDTLNESASNFWTAGPQLSIPLFRSGSLKSLKQAQEAKVDATFALYQQTIQTALRDVERSANRVRHAQQEVAARSDSLSSAQTAHRLARAEYEAGSTPFDELLAVESQLNLADVQLAQAEYNLAQQIVNLGKALGGGWSTGQPFNQPAVGMR